MKLSLIRKPSNKRVIPHFDIPHGAPRRTLSLRPKDPRWFHLLFDELAVFLKQQRWYVLAVLIFAVATAGFTLNYHVTHAETATLYPTSCLGGWTNPQNAEGEPGLTLDAAPDQFTDSNSAVLPADTSGEIFCGGFSGEIPPASSPKRVLLVLSFASASTATPVAPIQGESFASSTGAILDAPAADPSFTAPPDPVPVEPSEPVAPEILPDVPAPSVDSGLVSMLTAFLPVAHADTVPETTTPTTTSVEVRYSFDGTTWQTLETLDTAHLSSSTFELTLPDGTPWNDISNLQISVRSVASIDQKPTIYLDGMKLDVEYGSEVPQPVDPVIDLPAADLNISAVSDGTGTLKTEAITGGDGKPSLRFSIPGGGNLFIYRGAAELPVMSSGMGDSPLDMPAYFFYPDIYTAIVVGNDASCLPKPVRRNCEQSSTFLGESTFTVSVSSTTQAASLLP